MPADPVHVNGKWMTQTVTGTQRFAEEMVVALARAEKRALVLHVPCDGRDASEFAAAGVEVRRSRWSGIVFEQLYLPWASRRRLLLNFAGPAPVCKVRQLVTMHDATPFRFPGAFTKAFSVLYFLMYLVLARTAEHLVTVSDFSARELSTVLRVPVGRFTVVPGAADALDTVVPERPESALPEAFYLVVGTKARHKNLPRTVSALLASGRQVVVVGLAGSRQVFASTGGLSDAAIVAGRLPDPQLVWLYRHAAALVFPSLYEGFGLPPVEAQLLGCVVVSSSAASMPEVCGNGAVYFDPENEATLLSVLSRVEHDGALADRLRQCGYRNAARYSWARSAASVSELLGGADDDSPSGRAWPRGAGR